MPLGAVPNTKSRVPSVPASPRAQASGVRPYENSGAAYRERRPPIARSYSIPNWACLRARGLTVKVLRAPRSSSSSSGGGVDSPRFENQFRTRVSTSSSASATRGTRTHNKEKRLNTVRDMGRSWAREVGARYHRVPRRPSQEAHRHQGVPFPKASPLTPPLRPFPTSSATSGWIVPAWGNATWQPRARSLKTRWTPSERRQVQGDREGPAMLTGAEPRLLASVGSGTLNRPEPPRAPRRRRNEV